MTDLWVARDRTGCELHYAKPEKMYPPGDDGDLWNGKTYACAIPRDLFPDLKPGECRRLVMAEEKSE